jgi:1-acyl-sn-glycerol-3-phosphate acyltransferase
MATGAPIVPVGLIGTAAVQAPGRRLPRVGRAVRVVFGSPFALPAAEHVADAKAVLRDATNRLMREIGALSGQPYVDRFATVPS